MLSATVASEPRECLASVFPSRAWGPLAQLEEQLTLNQQVPGSIPGRVTKPLIRSYHDLIIPHPRHGPVDTAPHHLITLQKSL